MRAWALLTVIVAAFLVQTNVVHAAGENTNGKWDAPVSTPIVASSAAVLPNGKVLLWAADGATFWSDGTGASHSVLLDLQTGSQQYRTTALDHNMFCTGTTLLTDGRVLINGGGRLGTDDGAPATTIFDPATNSFSRVQNMVVPRGYNANTILSDGSVFTLGGSWSGASTQNRIGEIWTPSTGWRTMPGIPTTGMTTSDPNGDYLSDAHFWMIPTGNGKVLYAGPSPNMKWLNTNGSGSVTEAGPRGDDVYAVNGTAVMYDAGKILKAGGATAYEFVNASNSAYVIDTTQGASVTKLAPMTYRRAYANGVALPDGKVMIIGGQSYADQDTGSNSILVPEIWNPATGLFSSVAPLSIPRNYHSIALLLPDGRVLAGGGGLCSCSVNHPDYQIYSPPYLFDANSNLASRPAITNAPSELPYGGAVSVATDRPVAAFSLVRMGTATHALDNDQRRLSITFTVAGTNLYNVNIPSNSNLLLPGYWMLFALDANGVPSVAKIVHVQPNTIAKLISPATITAAVGQTVAVQPEVVKLQDFLSFGGQGLPPGMTVDSLTGRIGGAPTVSGTFSGALTATDGQRTVSTYLTITVLGSGAHPPNIVTPPPQVNAVGDSVSLAISASDQDGGPLTFAAAGLPGGLTINSNTGIISGAALASGSFTPTVTVTDNTSLSTSVSFAWTVTGSGREALLSANSAIDHGTGPFTTNSFTPASNSLLVVLVGSSYLGTSYNPANITVSGGGLTWTRQLSVSNANGNESALQLWWAEVGTAAPMTLTLDEGPDNVTLFMVQVRNYTNYNPNNKFGGSIVNAALSQPTGAMTLSAAPAASSEVIAARVHNASSGTFTSATPGAGWTELYDQYPFSNVTGLESQVRTGSTSSSVAWTNVNDAGIGAEELLGLALEIKAGSPPGNRAPTIVTPVAQTSSLGASINLPISASDPDGDALIYSAAGLPGGLAINSTNGVISGTATAMGSFTPTVTVTDPGGLSASASFAWTVSGGANRPPTITAPAAQTSSLGATVSLSVAASDPDGDALSYTATGLPGGLAINASTGVISGTTTTAGSFTPTVTATDPGGLSASASFAWTVTGSSGRISLLSTNSAKDHGTGPFNTPSFAPASNSLLVVLVGSSYVGTGNNPANITVTGGGLNWTRQLSVSRENGNESALQLWWAEVGTAAPITLTLDEGPDNVAVFMVQVRNYTGYDAAGKFGGSVINAALSQPTGAMTLSAAPAASSEVIAARVHNSANGTFTSATPGAGWTELYDQYPYSDVTGLESQVRTGSTSPAVAWTNVNDAGMGTEELLGLALEIKAAPVPVNRPPTIVAPPAQVSSLGAAVSLAISASDPDGNVLTYSTTGLPGGLAVNPGNGVISGTTTAMGSFTPTVTVTDPGGLSASASFSWTVTGPANRAPTVTAPPAQTSILGASISLAITASDPDGDALSYGATGLPGGLSIHPSSGIISGSTTQVGTFSPTVTVTDPGGLSASASFAWTVSNPNNRAPAITAPPSQISSIGVQVSLAVSASDPDGDTLSFAATGLPGGLAIDTSSGVISGTIAAVGTFNPTVTVTDPGGLSASVTFAWSVADTEPSVTSLPVTPKAVGVTVTYAPVIASPAGVTYSWNFGDGTPATGFAAAPGISHAFGAAGVYNVILTMKNFSGSEFTYGFMQAIYVPPTATGGGASSSAMALEPRSDSTVRLWVANPDNDSVAVINLATNTRIAEIPVGVQPVSVARSGSGTIWVLNRGSASISVIDPSTLAVSQTFALPYGSRPGGLVFAGTAGTGFVALGGKGQLAAVSTTGTVAIRTNGLAFARFIATNGAKTRLYMPSFITPPFPGESTAAVATVDAGGQPVGGQVFDIAAGGALQRTFILRHSERADTLVSGRGFPNYLGAPVVSPDGASLWVPSKQDNLRRGKLRDGLDLNFQNSVRAIISRVDLTTGLEDIASRIDVDNSGLVAAAAFHPTGAFLFAALQSSREIAVLDPVGRRELFRFQVGRAPSSLLVSSDGNTLYAGNFMDRTVSVVNLTALLTTGKKSVSIAATVATIGTEKLAADVVQGKKLFYDAADPRLAREGYLSCAVCHQDGDSDGRTWDMTGFGEGLRNTISLVGHGGMAQGFLHWTANFDEIQDFEGQIRGLAGGTGLMSDADFFANNRSQPLGGPKAGLSADLDALAAYVGSLTVVPASPFRNADGTNTNRANSGRTVFANKACGTCHAGTPMTISGDATTLRDIGTIDAASGKRLGAALTGLDVPSLRGVWATGPYLHNGKAATLNDAILAHNGVTLTATQMTNLVEYLRQIEQIP